jgi:hypothetical protein
MQEQERAANMKNLAVSIGAIVLVATATFVWSRAQHGPVQASTASSISIGPTAAQAAVSISPFDVMMNHKGPLPTEQWDPI